MGTTVQMGLRALYTVVLLFGSNCFMTTAWYYHLKTNWSMVVAILTSWAIAFFEYCLQVPANRLGHFEHGGPFSSPQLKIIQEAIALCVFGAFSVLVLKEKLRWTDLVAFALILTGVACGMLGRELIKDDGASAVRPYEKLDGGNGTALEMT